MIPSAARLCVILAVILGGCSGAPGVHTGGGVADVVLPIRWAAGPAVRGETTFVLEEPAEAGTQLRLEGFWWRVGLTLDGTPLPAAFPGYAPLNVALPTLSAGEHHLVVSVEAPGGDSPVVSLRNGNRAPLAGALTLRLQRSVAVEAIAVPLLDGVLHPAVTLREPPPGGTLEVVVSRDGERVVSWGPQPADAALAALPWPGERWAIGRPELYLVTAILRDAAGAVLSERTERVGFREATLREGTLYLNGAQAPLLAVRSQPGRDPSVAAALAASGGLNAVELHGAVPPAGWLARFDELGLPVVHLPRCDGGLWKPGDDELAIRATHAAVLAEQESRLLVEAASHPSVLAWACEGSDSSRAPACGGLHRDPLGRPVFGVDLTATSISGAFAPVPRGPTWVIEVGHPPGGMLPAPAITAGAFLRGVGTWAVGGVVPAPQEGEGEAWAEAWTAAARTMGAEAWTSVPRRAASVVVVAGLRPGQIAVLHAPFLAPTGAAADATGQARIQVWYAGAAEVVVSGVRHEVRTGGQVVTVTIRQE